MKDKKNNAITLIEEYLKSVINGIEQTDTKEVFTVAAVLTHAYDENLPIYVFGNGGSAATASHFACDLNKGVSVGLKKRFKVICLNDNIPSMLAIGNDMSYDDIFVEQLKNFLKPNEIVICFTGSGNSKNILKAMKYANTKGAFTIAFCGFDGGKVSKMAKEVLCTNVKDMEVSEDLHLLYCHSIKRMLMEGITSIGDKE